MGAFKERIVSALRQAPLEKRARYLIFLTLLALFAFALAVMMGFRQSVQYADALDGAKERATAENHIVSFARHNVAQLRMQLMWDSAYRAVGEDLKDTQWADEFLGGFLYPTVGYSRLYLVRADGKMLRAWREGKPFLPYEYEKIELQVKRDLDYLAQNQSIFGDVVGYQTLEDTVWPLGLDDRPLVRWTYSLLMFEKRPALVTTLSIVPDSTFSLMEKTPNHVVSVQYLEDSFLAEMSSSLALEDMQFDAAPPAANEHRNGVVLQDERGNILGWITWAADLPGSAIRENVAPIFKIFLFFLVVLLIGGALLVWLVLAALSEKRSVEAQANHTEFHDRLTGLPNRLAFQKYLEECLLKHATPIPHSSVLHDSDRARVIVACLDLDGFKGINDTFGQRMADELLVAFAERWQSYLWEDDFIARLSGDEFAMVRIVPSGTLLANSLPGADLQEMMQAPFHLSGNLVDVTAACGMAWSPDHGVDAGQLQAYASIALSQAQAKGRGRWRAYTQAMGETVRTRRAIEVELARVVSDFRLAEGEISIVYQPIVRVSDSQVKGLEALLRWRHKEHGAIPPSIFVPLAEQAGLMPALGELVLRNVFADMRDYEDLEFSINLSPLQIMSSAFPERLQALVAEFQVNSKRVVFEVTEGVVMDPSTTVYRVLEEVKRMGFRIALDDFGIGYSSLGYLRSFGFDRIKIDRSFVQNVQYDQDARAILSAIVSMGISLRMQVVAEGVETLEQRDLVAAAGCHYIQGFYYSRPVPREKLHLFVAGVAV